MSMIFGDRKTVAIELELVEKTPDPLAGFTLWCEEQPIGDMEDPIYIYTMLSFLEGLVQSLEEYRHDQIFLLQAEAALKKLESLPEHLLSGRTEFLDYYFLYAVCNDQSIRFLWKWHSTTGIEGELEDAVVPIPEFQRVVKELRQMYDSLIQG